MAIQENSSSDIFPDKEMSNRITRRHFLQMGVTAAGAMAFITMDRALGFYRTPETDNKEQQVPTPEYPIDHIKKKYGIEVPKEGEITDYQICLNSSGEYTHCGEEKSTQLTSEEANTVLDALNTIPNPGNYAQLIIPFRKNQEGVIGGGDVLGKNWEYFMDSLKYPEGYPKDSHTSDKFAIAIYLSNKNLNESLPPAESITNVLPLLTAASLNTSDVKVINKIDYPWTTYGERLKQVVVHEVGGHGINEYAGRIKVNNNPQAEYEASGMSIFGGIPLDTFNPITASFAKINGWIQIPNANFMEQWGEEGKIFANEVRNNNPKLADWPVWDRDPKIWGTMEDRKIRLDSYASYGTIKETFATFFTFYSLSRIDKKYDQSLLTKTELEYFDAMFAGLTVNPESYIQRLIKQNPGPSFGSLNNENISKEDNSPETTPTPAPKETRSRTITYNKKDIIKVV